jgi:hypothetical protein
LASRGGVTRKWQTKKCGIARVGSQEFCGRCRKRGVEILIPLVASFIFADKDSRPLITPQPPISGLSGIRFAFARMALEFLNQWTECGGGEGMSFRILKLSEIRENTHRLLWPTRSYPRLTISYILDTQGSFREGTFVEK